MASCQSRAGGQGLLSPLATEEDLAVVSDLIAEGCRLHDNWEDEFFFVGLTSFGRKQSLRFLDRPHPGSSTALLRARAVPGEGFTNGSWPDDPALADAGAEPAVLGGRVISDAPIRPLCAAVRLLVTGPTATSADAAALATGAGADTAFVPVAACGELSRNDDAQQTDGDSNRGHQLEVHFHNCDGRPVGQAPSGIAAAHAFICRVPANTNMPPSPAPSPAPPSRGPRVPPRPPTDPFQQPWKSPGAPAASLQPQGPLPPPGPPAQDAPSPPAAAPPRIARRQRFRLLLQLPNSPPAAESSPQLPQPAPSTPPAPPAAPPSPPPAAPKGSAAIPPTPPPGDGAPPVPPASPTLNPTPSAAVVSHRCDVVVLNTVVTSGGGATAVAAQYLACHVPASWSEAVDLCEGLLAGGTLAAFESQAQVDAVSKFVGSKDMAGSYDFWFGLASGSDATQPPRRSGVPLEYVLTDPRVPPTYIARLWSSGVLGVHNSCRAEVSPPPHSVPLSKPPSQPAATPPKAPPQTPSPQAPTLQPAQQPLQSSGRRAMHAVSRGDSASGRDEFDARRQIQAEAGPSVVVATASSLSAMPLASGCCASLTILPAGDYSSNTTSGNVDDRLLLRLCHEKINFICQAPVSASVVGAVPATQGSASTDTGGATTLIASLFLDALASSYSGAFKVFRAQLELQLLGVSYNAVMDGGDGQAAVRLRSETAEQLSRNTGLPVWSFVVLALTPGSVVAQLNLTVHGLPRATLDNFREFLSSSLANRQAAELFAEGYRASWGVQNCTVRVVGVEELSVPAPPSPVSSEDETSDGKRLLIISTTIVGGVLLISAVVGLVLLRRWRRRAASVYVSAHDEISRAKALPPSPFLRSPTSQGQQQPKSLSRPPSQGQLSPQPQSLRVSPSARISAGRPLHPGGVAPSMGSSMEWAAAKGSPSSASRTLAPLGAARSGGQEDNGGNAPSARNRLRPSALDVSALGLDPKLAYSPLSPGFSSRFIGEDSPGLSLAGSPLHQPWSFDGKAASSGLEAVQGARSFVNR